MDHDPQQELQFSRVKDKIAAAIVEFARLRMPHTPRFKMSELVDHVRGRGYEVAPDSPGRILRMLRGEGDVQYRVVSRSASLYELTYVRPE